MGNEGLWQVSEVLLEETGHCVHIMLSQVQHFTCTRGRGLKVNTNQPISDTSIHRGRYCSDIPEYLGIDLCLLKVDKM